MVEEEARVRIGRGRSSASRGTDSQRLKEKPEEAGNGVEFSRALSKGLRREDEGRQREETQRKEASLLSLYATGGK